MINLNNDKPDGGFNAASYTNLQLTELTELHMRNYLYNIFLNKIECVDLIVDKVLSFHSPEQPIPRLPIVNFDPVINCFRFPDSALDFSVSYKNEKYECFFLITNEMFGEFRPNHALHVIGITNQTKEVNGLAELIYKEALKESPLKDKTISICIVGNNKNGTLLEGINIVNTPVRNLDEIFIRDSKREHINRFIYAIKNYHSDKQCFRYLLSGQPGTGKTQLMNAIIHSLENKCTIVLTQGGNFPIEDIFNFCSLFDPCLLVIDDIDFLVANREDTLDKRSLGTFLQYLDGFIPQNLFIVASTNDKKLVDAAASRPGRFDLIIDMSEISSEDYFSLIYRETSDPEIINLFNNEIIDAFKSKNVTGAFIVSLIRQLTSLKKMKGSIAGQDLKNYFNIIHRGYYSSNADNYREVVGFGN
jgi:predicted AAA+ superfamily ATPase